MKKIYVLIIFTILIATAIFIFSKSKENKEQAEKMTKQNKFLQEQAQAKEQAQKQSALALADDARQFSESELVKAEAAIAAGIKIEDGQNDFFAWKEEGKDANYNNPKPYALPYLDYKSFQLGADQNYLYVRHQVYGVIPKDQPAADGDLITGMGLKLEGVHSAGREKYSTLLVDGISWKCAWDSCRAKINHYAFVDETMESMAKKNDVPVTEIGMVGDGPGTDCIISAFPLEKVGLKYGQEIIFRIGVESSSEKWHHATFDEVLEIEGSKFGKQVIYKIGSNKFVLEVPTEDEMANFN